MKQIFILFLLWFGLSLSAQDQISLLFVGDLMQHQAQIDAARQGDGYNYNDCFRQVKKEISEADMAIGNLEVTLGGASTLSSMSPRCTACAAARYWA